LGGPYAVFVVSWVRSLGFIVRKLFARFTGMVRFSTGDGLVFAALLPMMLLDERTRFFEASSCARIARDDSLG
jgi:hypothetical protein